MGPRGFLSWQILSIPLGPAFQLNLVQALGMVPPALTTQARGDYSRRYSFYDIFILVSSAAQLIYKVAFVLASIQLQIGVHLLVFGLYSQIASSRALS